jgi:hypothetical protein
LLILSQESRHDDKILALDKAFGTELTQEGDDRWLISSDGHDERDAIHAPCFLCPRIKRPGSKPAAEKLDEIAPLHLSKLHAILHLQVAVEGIGLRAVSQIFPKVHQGRHLWRCRTTQTLRAGRARATLRFGKSDVSQLDAQAGA